MWLIRTDVFLNIWLAAQLCPTRVTLAVGRRRAFYAFSHLFTFA